MSETIQDLYTSFSEQMEPIQEDSRYFRYLFEMAQASGTTIEQQREELVKVVDEEWISMIEDSLDAINTIMGNATDDRPSLRATVICAGGENCGKRFTTRASRPALLRPPLRAAPAPAPMAAWVWATAPARASLTPSTSSTAWPSWTAKSAPAARPAP